MVKGILRSHNEKKGLVGFFFECFVSGGVFDGSTTGLVS
jgi:hypothetical protein